MDRQTERARETDKEKVTEKKRDKGEEREMILNITTPP